MNLGSILTGAASGFLTTGNPIGAVVGGVAAAVGGSSSNILSSVGNGALTTGENAYLAGSEQIELQELGVQLGIQQQSAQFNEVTDEKSEIMRESNELRTMAMEQRKADTEITKEFIKSIG